MNAPATRSTVLALRYRPARFEQLVGQPHVVQALSHALTSQRLHHAYLFTGTRGVGKTTVSRILAKSLNCTGEDGQGGITASPCGVCPACRDIDAGRFVDYVELDAASNRGVDEISQLLDQAVYKPVVGRFKVYMIDEVHMLSNHAFNAMLKTLEEPPDYLKFVLATTDPQKVPPTVLSRCLQFNLRPMAPETIQDHLVQVLAAEGVQAQPGALALISRAAQGSMRDALSLTDQAIAYTGGQVQEDALRRMLGTPDRGHVLALIGHLAQGDGAAVVAAVDALRAQGAGAGALLEDMAWVLQQMAVLQLASQAGLSASLSDSEAARVAELAQALPPEDTQLLYSLCLRGRPELALAPDEYSGLIMVLLRLLAFRPAEPDAGDTARAGGAVERPAPARPPARAEQRSAAPRIATQISPAARIEEQVRPRDAAQGRAPVARAAGLVEPAAAPARGRQDAPADAPQPVHAPPRQRQGQATGPELAPREVHDARVSEANGTAQALAGSEPERNAPVSCGAAEAFAFSEQAASLADQWETWVQQLCAQEAVHALPRELALQSVWVATHDEANGVLWELVCERETLAADHVASRLAAALSAAAGLPVRLQVRTGPAQDTPAQRAAIRAADRQRAAEASIRSDPLVTRLMQQFSSARIVPGSVRPL